MLVIYSLITPLTQLFNKVFHTTYPKCWSAVMKCLPKKGKLDIPNLRGIGLKDLFAKIYDSILKRRLERWLDVPIQQTAYQKGKGCSLHVFYVRCLIATCQKLKKPLFVGVTDFEAAFDLISRRNLFKKLIDLGISMLMLKALVEMYSVTLSYVEINSEYSRTFNMTAGVIQGSATSTILFMAYTADLVKLFNDKFPIEELVHLYHILLHADDCLLLSTCRKLFEQKFQFLEEYCEKNSIRLQPLKCSFLAINTDEKDSIKLKKGVINHTEESIYLGSILSAKGSVKSDVTLEIRCRKKQFNRFYAFLRENYNAPLAVKENVLDACVTSAVLTNCETWGDANVKSLELLYRKSLKYMLGVRKQVCNEFPYIELAKPTLQSMIQRRQYIFYKNCTRDRDWPLQRHIIRQALDANCSYIKQYSKLMMNYRCADEITMKSLQQLKDSVVQKAEAGHSRYVSYLALNPALERPVIYSVQTPTLKLHNASRLRMISHELKIEMGRHKRPPVPTEERRCACDEVETEQHFLEKCRLYSHIRRSYNVQEEQSASELLNCGFTCDFTTELLECRKLFLGT